jgi:dihydroflavonol-4-reductase
MQVVTGATGHIGNALVRALVAKGVPGVRALVGPSRRTASLAGLDVELVEADVRDYDSLLPAFRGAEMVYHAAGIVSIETRGLERLRSTNVEGTRNVLAACRETQVGRLIYTSSVHALVEPPRGTPLDETFPVDPASVRGPYAQTKAEATRLVLSAAEEGLDTVVVFPSGVIGPYDFRLSYAGKFIRDCAQGPTSMAPTTSWTCGTSPMV